MVLEETAGRTDADTSQGRFTRSMAREKEIEKKAPLVDFVIELPRGTREGFRRVD